MSGKTRLADNDQAMRILVVDDEETFRFLIGNRLEGSGHLVETVASGEAALEQLSTSLAERSPRVMAAMKRLVTAGSDYSMDDALEAEADALTAYLLNKNGVIPEDQVLDAQSLPQVKMPNRDGYVLPDWKHGMPRPFPNKP